MRIENSRLFPYPLLNSEKLFSQFKLATFQLMYNETVTEKDYILENVYIILDNPYLLNLLDKKIVEACCVIECAPTMFRKKYIISTVSSKIVVPLGELNGKISVSAYIIAKQNIDDYYCEDFLEDYEDYKFSIEKNDILAYDVGFINRLDFNLDDKKKSSIFLVIKDVSIKDETMRLDFDSSNVIAYLPEEQWNIYEKTKNMDKLQNLYFSIIGIPALSFALARLQKEASVDALGMEYKWFKVFANAYENVHQEELTDDLFAAMDIYLETEKIMNTPITKSLDDIFDIIVKGEGGQEYAD